MLVSPRPSPADSVSTPSQEAFPLGSIHWYTSRLASPTTSEYHTGRYSIGRPEASTGYGVRAGTGDSTDCKLKRLRYASFVSQADPVNFARYIFHHHLQSTASACRSASVGSCSFSEAVRCRLQLYAVSAACPMCASPFRSCRSLHGSAAGINSGLFNRLETRKLLCKQWRAVPLAAPHRGVRILLLCSHPFAKKRLLGAPRQ